MKKILITGANSYIGTKVESHLLNSNNDYLVDTLDMKDSNWRNYDFSNYDTVFHVAGIAHVSNDKKLDNLYFEVNRDLAIETAIKAKNSNVKQFIFMSSMIIYGKDNKVGKLEALNTQNYAPINAYGQSKLEADLEIQRLKSNSFNVAIIRTPVVYGPNAKGNFPRLQRLALKLPIIPKINNIRSMIYIDNLAEAIKVIIDNKESGIFYPQNNEYTSTYEIMKLTKEANNKKVRSTKLFNWLIKLFSFVSPTINKVYGNKYYDQSESSNLIFNKISLEDSIKRIKDEEQ